MDGYNSDNETGTKTIPLSSMSVAVASKTDLIALLYSLVSPENKELAKKAISAYCDELRQISGEQKSDVVMVPAIGRQLVNADRKPPKASKDDDLVMPTTFAEVDQLNVAKTKKVAKEFGIRQISHYTRDTIDELQTKIKDAMRQKNPAVM